MASASRRPPSIGGAGGGSAAQAINRWFSMFETRMTQQVPNVVAETATEYFKDRFLQKNWEGTPWPKYNPRNDPKRREPTRGSLLMRSNLLFGSVRPVSVAPGRITITAGGSKVPYARAHNEGFTGYMYVPGYTNRNFMGRGQAVKIRAHRRYVRLPRRQYMGHSRMLNRAIVARIRTLLSSPSS